MTRYHHTKKLGLILGLICLFGFKQTEEIHIYSIGDSTMADYRASYLNKFGKGYPIRGWMQLAPSLFTEQVHIHNEAMSGRSSKSFRDEGLWSKVIQQVKAGDYVFIQFGHNDAKPDTARHTDPHTTFKQNIERYVREIQAKKAHAILFTSIPHRKFNQEGHIVDTHGAYLTVVGEVAKSTHTPLIDLHALVATFLEKTGSEESKKLFLHIPPGKFASLPEGKKDDTHLSGFGAKCVAELAVSALKETNLPLRAYIK
jgi:lysophospholipase L1-like esterase